MQLKQMKKNCVKISSFTPLPQVVEEIGNKFTIHNNISSLSYFSAGLFIQHRLVTDVFRQLSSVYFSPFFTSLELIFSRLHHPLTHQQRQERQHSLDAFLHNFSQSCDQLQSLALSEDCLNDSMLLIIKSARWIGLKTLELPCCNITARGAKIISEMEMPELKTLRLDGCSIGNLGAKWLAKGQRPNLLMLSIRRARLTGDSVKVLSKLRSNLLKLDISDNLLCLRMRQLSTIQCTCLICYQFQVLGWQRRVKWMNWVFKCSDYLTSIRALKSNWLGNNLSPKQILDYISMQKFKSN